MGYHDFALFLCFLRMFSVMSIFSGTIVIIIFKSGNNRGWVQGDDLKTTMKVNRSM